jgi:hypothetical protein
VAYVDHPDYAPTAVGLPARFVLGTNPGLGADFLIAFTGPGTIVSFQCSLVTSATVANRFVGIALKDNLGNPVFSVNSPVVQPASKTFDYIAWPGASNAVIAGQGVVPASTQINIPVVTVQSGWKLFSTTDSIDVADKWQGLNVCLS